MHFQALRLFNARVLFSSECSYLPLLYSTFLSPSKQTRKLISVPCFHRSLRTSTILKNEQESSEPDKLYKIVQLEVRGHEPAVLKSYEWFVTQAAKELGITVSRTWQPKKIHDRYTLLKSVFVHKKHMVQYEMRTHFYIIELKYLTGSTADTYLEYIERNLPEGVAMKVTKHEIEKIPSHIAPPTQEGLDVR